ncbi:type II secretion system minor pseudopilin GspK [Natronospira bacteriovora]|uniref:Type II secretion system protein K n=1 Tax=Natronospira bacteriovora TaxID=3069753 RepID=A0ABU0W5E9_9GAMM|nr:type II secretion system minor pseudopilin GspK [Natronospira sp. AB-CW4]MDQ2069247.1 type II secretion system minor pseudopilin GspK [Natronospira sp. AB-CW4]
MRVSVHRQRGVALITALVVVALAAVIATDLLWRTFLDQRRTETVVHGNQARQYLRGGEDWAAHILRRDREETESDNLAQPWAQQMPPLPVDGGQILGRLEDQQGLFNLNNLITPEGQVNRPAVDQFRRLLMLLEIDPDAADAVLDWMDPDQEPRLRGAEDGFYLGLSPAYRTADQAIQAVSELRLVEGFRDPEIFERIEPYLVALPSAVLTPINVNTAPPPVLASLAEEFRIEEAEALSMLQEEGGFENVGDFHEAFGRTVEVDVDVRSYFFRLTIRADIGTASTTMYSLLFRDENGATSAISRTYGAL